MPRVIFVSIACGSGRVPESTSEPISAIFPSDGAIYTFNTSPLFEFVLQQTGRHAAFKILGADDEYIVIAVLEGVWNAPPSFNQVSGAPILREHRFAHTGRLAVFGMNSDWWTPSDLNGVLLLGYDRVSSEEKVLAAQIASRAPGSSYSTLRNASHSAEGEWRWTHDREAVMAEAARKAIQDEAARAAREERYRTRLRKLTWDQLLAETPFERWSPSPPFPPQDFALGARDTIHDACRALSALGPKPRKAAVRAILRACVDWFNEADERAGGVIETEEREDICAALEEMAFVARQKGLVEEIDQWRNW